MLCITCYETRRKKAGIPLTYLAMASWLSLSGSMVMKSGVRLGKDGIRSVTLTIIIYFRKPETISHLSSNKLIAE